MDVGRDARRAGLIRQGEDTTAQRAGGRIADIAVGATGRMQWLDAARHLRNGGRGTTFGQLLAEMLEDHPSNQDLTELRGRYESEPGGNFS